MFPVARHLLQGRQHEAQRDIRPCIAINPAPLTSHSFVLPNLARRDNTRFPREAHPYEQVPPVNPRL